MSTPGPGSAKPSHPVSMPTHLIDEMFLPEPRPKPPEGVWMVAYRLSDGDDITPFGSELGALRCLNDDPDGKRAWFVPFGKSLHDVILDSKKGAGS